ncbi:hypothetical protein BEWA_054250 [Theileria equi strain WA]|uniref:Uncharacterized protein n=1 Tax=Theileria equi strain WA TaxID=1537102 RepID=L1LDM1_THEEQ|nr:hypothetical protein BEWA_054250 [Theileria equi strain WA]EKX73369.1 hypothetical protein BEWA_054250 [Theileria equi strain WA]|eukprot:XP_004832821.1 hypothetical protein BEWA_054250 [Theileria equi strain WA]
MFSRIVAISRPVGLSGKLCKHANSVQFVRAFTGARREGATDYSSGSKHEDKTGKDDDPIHNQYKASQNLWDTLVPERNWSLFSPQFWILFVATCSLYVYNRMHEKEDSVDLIEKEREAHRKAVGGH